MVLLKVIRMLWKFSKVTVAIAISSGLPSLSMAASIEPASCSRASIVQGSCSKDNSLKLFRNKQKKISMILVVPKDQHLSPEGKNILKPILYQFVYEGKDVYVKTSGGQYVKFESNRANFEKGNGPKYTFRVLKDAEYHPSFRNVTVQSAATLAQSEGIVCTSDEEIDCTEYDDPGPSDGGGDSNGEGNGEGGTPSPPDCDPDFGCPGDSGRWARYYTCMAIANAKYTSRYEWCFTNTNGIEYFFCNDANEIQYEINILQCVGILITG